MYKFGYVLSRTLLIAAIQFVFQPETNALPLESVEMDNIPSEPTPLGLDESLYTKIKNIKEYTT